MQLGLVTLWLAPGESRWWIRIAGAFLILLGLIVLTAAVNQGGLYIFAGLLGAVTVFASAYLRDSDCGESGCDGAHHGKSPLGGLSFPFDPC